GSPSGCPFRSAPKYHIACRQAALLRMQWLTHVSLRQFYIGFFIMQHLPGAESVAQEANNVSGASPVHYQLDYIASSKLPTPWAEFSIHIFLDPATSKEHLMLTLGDVSDGQPVLARVHSECLTGDALFSQRCD